MYPSLMPELSPPTDVLTRHAQRVAAIARREHQISMLMAQQRLDVAALALEDTPFGYRKYVGDELALALSRSP
ncbi:MAG: hypothetical protein JWM02_3455 [Frankiales bacterium]|nr:hypothetical protein [Frankiales bacterium]